ncbi:MAG: class D sortase [Acidobacteriota bacterium]|nr:class D sortase [Acidobacteriota bacterium]
MRKSIILLSWVLIASGGYLAWRGASDYYESVESQRVEALNWENQNPEQTSSDASPVPARIDLRRAKANGAQSRYSPGESLAKLSIPRLSTVLYVLEGTDDNNLKRGPGHLEGSVMPGRAGNCVIAGHRDTHFRILKNITRGDEILIQSRQGTYRYKVTGTSVVSPDNTDSLQPTSKAVLNLITCFPFNYVGSAPRRFVVHADLIQS